MYMEVNGVKPRGGQNRPDRKWLQMIWNDWAKQVPTLWTIMLGGG